MGLGLDESPLPILLAEFQVGFPHHLDHLASVVGVSGCAYRHPPREVAGDDQVRVGAAHSDLRSVAERVDASVEWAHSRPAGDRAARLMVDSLPEHPERLDAVIGEIVKHKSVLYG